jgi:hypothetical protein
MSRITLQTEKTKLEEKLVKERGLDEAQEYIAQLTRSTKEALEERLLDLSKTGQGLINTKNADSELQLLKDKVRELSRDHNENIRRNKDHQRLVSLIISEQFGDDLMDIREKASDQE